MGHPLRADNETVTASGATGSGGPSSEGTGSHVTEHRLPRRRPTPGRVATRWIIAAALLVWLVYEGVTGNPALFGLIGFVLLGVVGVLVLGSTYSRIRFHDGQFHGHLLVSFHEDSLPGPEVFPDLRVVPRRESSQLGRQGLSGGKLRIQDEGLSWHAGSLFTLSQRIEGSFFIPWSWIKLVDVGDVPMKLRLLGGALAIQLNEGRGTLDGEFLGSHKHILEVLRRSPLG